MRIAWRTLPPVLLVLALLGAWELYVDLGGANRSFVLAAPHEIAKALYTDRSLLWSNFLVTAEEVASVVVFLASSKSVAINGDAIAVGGGARGPVYY